MKILAMAENLHPGTSYSRHMDYVPEGGRYIWVLRHANAANAEYVQKFDDERACVQLEDAGFTPYYSRTVDGDSIWIRLWDFGKDPASGRVEGADFIRTTDLQSACGEPGTLIESSNVGYSYGVASALDIPHLDIHRPAENYLTAVKSVLSSCGNGYTDARDWFAKTKAEKGIGEARKAFREMLFTAKLEYGNYDPNGYAGGNWTAKTEDRILPCLTLAVEVA